jgi:7-carboxy-7-deazaguanine synthase
MDRSSNDRLLVAEVFRSIQGESTFAGLPCTFVRLSGCNLRCAWCDTVWASEGGEQRSIPDLLDEVARLGLDLVEVTGGEPLLQEACPSLLEALLLRGAKVLLETNGSVDVGLAPPGVHVIMDLKAPLSGMCDRNLWTNLDHLRPGAEVKIVVAGREDYDWARAVLRTGRVPAGVPVLLSPATDRMEASALATWILDDALPVRLGMQIHKVIWPGTDRGV